jgi:hypothetical protein
MRFSELTIVEIGRLLNGKNHPHEAAIAHLALAASRSAESLTYLADLDERRFGGVWPTDNYANDSVDDGHVRWAASGALTTLDLCMAAGAKLGGFFIGSSHREVSLRDFYSVAYTGKVTDERHRVPPPWRAWVDTVVIGPQYNDLLRVRNALVHADALRIVHGTTGALSGHSLRFGYNVGPLATAIQSSSHMTIMARDVVELSRDIAHTHMIAFIKVLQTLP